MKERISKLGGMHRTGYYSALKRNEVLIDATMWKYLENMLSERNQTQKLNVVFPFYEVFRIGKSNKKEVRLVVARG